MKKKIRDENEIFLLEMFGYKLQYLSHLCYVRVNTNLNLENRSMVYKPDEKELTHLIKNGYFFDNFKENSLNNIINEKKIKEQEELLRDLGTEENSDYYSDDDDDENYLDDTSDDDDSENSSRNSDADAAQEDHFEERNLEELMKKEDIVRDIKILSKKNIWKNS